MGLRDSSEFSSWSGTRVLWSWAVRWGMISGRTSTLMVTWPPSLLYCFVLALGHIGIIAVHVQCERVFCFLDRSDREKMVLNESVGRVWLENKVKNGSKIHVPDTAYIVKPKPLMSTVAKRGLWIWFCIYIVVSVKINGIFILYGEKIASGQVYHTHSSIYKARVGNGYYRGVIAK